MGRKKPESAPRGAFQFTTSFQGGIIMKKSLSILFAALLAFAVFAPIYAGADETVSAPASAVPIKAVEGPDSQ
jgi:hypothetical protein